MTSARSLVLPAMAAALAAVGIGAAAVGVPRRAPPAAVAAPALVPGPAATDTTSVPVLLPVHAAPASVLSASDLHRAVPPGILSRAAEARALERATACPSPAPEPSEETACDPARRGSVEIDWEVARDR
jgi:hypothetical protein